MATTFTPLESRCLFFGTYSCFCSRTSPWPSPIYIYAGRWCQGGKWWSPLSIGPIAFFDFQSDDWSSAGLEVAMFRRHLDIWFPGNCQTRRTTCSISEGSDSATRHVERRRWDGVFTHPETEDYRFRGGGRTQHVSVHDHEFVLLLDSVFGDLPPEDRLLECSPGAFRRRWAAGMQS